MAENAGFDKPSVLDREDHELFGYGGNIPTEFIAHVDPIRDQWLQALTRMACTRYGLWHVHIAQGVTDFDCLGFWTRYLKVDPQAQQVGATLQSALAQGKEEWVVTGYARVHTIAGAKVAIAAGRYIYTGSLDWDRQHVKNNKEYRRRTDGRGVGHIFCIIWYNQDWFRCVNSYWEDDWVFFMSSEHFDTLYSRYAIMTDPQLAHDVRVAKDNASKELAYKYVMSEARPNDSVSREEMAIIVWRLIGHIQQDVL